MSGIAGSIQAADYPADPKIISTIGASLEGRGPDGRGSWSRGGAAFVYTLLGNTPNTEDAFVARKHLTVLADARLDAKDELFQLFDAGERAALETTTDVGLILRSYERWGTGCLQHLAGDFSFAIWDSHARLLFCARDQFGVKPFYYFSTPHAFVFSNTLDCLLAHPGIELDLDRQAIADFLLFGQYQDPAATAFSKLRRLPAGHSLSWRSGTMEVRRYWSLPVGQPIRFRQREEYVAGFRHFLERAVSDRVQPQRTSVLMSGGLDSTMIAAVAAPKTRSLKSFAMVYDRLVPDPERHYAQVAAKALGIPLECLTLDAYRLFERAQGARQTTAEPVDEPLPGGFTEHLLQVKSHSQVALSGIGGDPLLYPSPHFAAQMLRAGKLGQVAGGVLEYVRMRRKLPAIGLRGAVSRKLGFGRTRQRAFPPWLNHDLVKNLSLHERWKRAQILAQSTVSTDRPEAYSILTEPGWPCIFESYDASVTRVPVDVRHPLFDLRLVNYCLGLPPIPWCVDKTLARAAMSKVLPDEVRLRPKSFAADAVAPRLAACPWLDSWKPVPALAEFVDRERVPVLATAGAEWDPHHRPFVLNTWLSQLTVEHK